MPSPTPSRRPQAVAAALAFVLLATLAVPVLAQQSDHPLRRDDQNSLFGGHRPDAILGGSTLRWVAGLEDVPLEMRYRCVTSNGENAQLCVIGELVPNPPGRRVTVFYEFNETAEVASTCGGADNCTFLTGSAVPSPTKTFTGAIPATAFESVSEASIMTAVARVLMDNAPGGGNCAGTSANPCIDPQHSSGQAFYSLLVDKSQPFFTVATTANSRAFNTTVDQWYLYSNENLTPDRIPTITVTAWDSATGAPVDTASGATRFWRDGDEETSTFARTIRGSHQVEYTYDYPGGGDSFHDNTSTEIHLRFRDTAGHQVGVDEPSGDPQLLLIMDITEPELDAAASQLMNATGVNRPHGLGEPLRIHVNTTDVGADIDTPEEFLNVEARLVTAGNLTSAWQRVPYNATLEHYYSDNLTTPTDPAQWASGLAWAEVRVTDPVGLTNISRVPGNVTIDADLPTLIPEAPVGPEESRLFTRERDIEFRIRANDPGDDDPWDPSGGGNTDGLGIDFDEVFVHYRVGATGAQSSVRMPPRQAENTFSVTRNFGEEDTVYYWFSVQDLAGNVRAYPEAGDPHETVNATANGGRFLQVLTDRVGPVIEHGKPQSYVGGPGNPEFWFNLTDEGAGIDPEEARLFWRVAGETQYRTAVLSEATVTHPVTDQQATVFRGSIDPQEDGAEIQYYVRARDLLENEATFGSASSPRSAIVDLTPPTVTVTAPERSTDAIFNITWEGQDQRSGVRDYTLQFRVGPAGAWIGVPERERTRLTSWEICAATDRTYEFRVSARDMVGNERGFPATADARTVVDAPESCAEPPRVTLDAPSPGATLTGTTQIEWRAISTTFPDETTVTIRVRGPGGTTTIADGLNLAGSHTWNTAAFSPNAPCFEDGAHTVQVVAVDPTQLEGVGEADVTLANGIADCEARFQSGNGGVDVGEFNPLYLLVVLAFTGLVAVFVVGMTRRW